MSISGIVGRTVAAGAILAALGTNTSCASTSAQRSDHPLAGKGGFSAEGVLTDGTKVRKVNYSVSVPVVYSGDFRNSVVERLEIHEPGESCIASSYLEDHNHDGRVDLVGFCNPRTELERRKDTVLYDDRVFTKGTAEGIMEYADQLFSEVKRRFNVEERLKDYSTLRQNPLKSLDGVSWEPTLAH